MRPPPSHGSSCRGTAVAAFVVGGLIVSIVAGVFLIDRPPDDLPGIALGSEAILVIERIAMLFATWLLLVVVLVRALAGDLPIEISGRGLRYADATTAQDGLLDSEVTFERIDDEFRALRRRIAMLEADQDAHAYQLGRYAMKGEHHGH